MEVEIQQDASFLWDVKSSNAQQLKSQMGIFGEGLPSIFALWPLMNYFSTRLLKWPVTLDYMKLLPQKAGWNHQSDLNDDEVVKFEVQWSAIPSTETPLPQCRARVYQGEACRAELSLEFVQRPPRDKPKPFQRYETQDKMLLSWAQNSQLVKTYLSAVDSQDPIFSSPEFAVAMGMARPLIPDMYLLFLLWREHRCQGRNLAALSVCFAQPALSDSELFLHQTIDGQSATGFLCDDMERAIFSDFNCQWDTTGAPWPVS